MAAGELLGTNSRIKDNAAASQEVGFLFARIKSNSTQRKNMAQGVSEPACKALLLCEKTVIEAGTGNISLINVIDRIPVIDGQTFPIEAFLQFTDAEGSYDFAVEVRDCDEGDVLARAEGPGIEIPDRNAVCNVLIPVPPLQLQHTRLYDFIVLANGVEIERQQFAVLQIEEDSEEDEDE